MDMFAKLKPSKGRKNVETTNRVETTDPVEVGSPAAGGKYLDKITMNQYDKISYHFPKFPGRVEAVNNDPVSLPTSLSHSYSLEWENLFNKPNMLPSLKERAVAGNLRSCRFRSIAWKIFLEVLPSDKSQWIDRTRQNRNNYEELREFLIVNPRKAVDSVDITLNNPLSQDEESPWNKFFQDNELRLTIKQDVIRTHPKIEFFQSNQLRNLMVDILFVYAKENPDISYRQGMHELLAPLIFVLHCDHQAFLHASEMDNKLNVMKEVLDPAFLEHDAYTMFCQVMTTVEPWYLSRDMFYLPTKTGSTKSLELINAWHVSLRDLSSYTSRWLRLLFGREFPMQDLLMLWDAIFGDGIAFGLVDYIFVAMLLYLRDILLTSDYTVCLTVLMKFPPVADVHYFVAKALWIRQPNVYPQPANYTHQGSIRVSSSMGSSTDNISNDGSAKDFRKYFVDNPAGSTVSLSHVEESMFRHNQLASSLAQLEDSNLRSAQSSPGIHHSAMFMLTPDDVGTNDSPSTYNSLPGKSSNQQKMTKMERELQDSVSRLQRELSNKNSMCRYCSSKLDVHIIRLQQDLSRQNVKVDEDIMLSLAGLKLVRDILNGTIPFSQDIAADDDDVRHNDDYSGSQYGGGDNFNSGLTSPETDISLSAALYEDNNRRASEQHGNDAPSPPDFQPPDFTAQDFEVRARANNMVEIHDFSIANEKSSFLKDSCVTNSGGGESKTLADKNAGSNPSLSKEPLSSSNLTSKFMRMFKTDTSSNSYSRSDTKAAPQQKVLAGGAASASRLPDGGLYGGVYIPTSGQCGGATALENNDRQLSRNDMWEREMITLDKKGRVRCYVDD
ncbi:unnamed protein product [Candidula unifasciata]|uniref:Rab-GAP TBC domain-containing protein n=1 Tax=Candidula unifasciata TaxID=100452 RepID=A0A8S3YME5_9EUPU|nr:unnamed protein product [Candidula unifasciata]